MPTTTRNEYLKAARNKTRFFASELIDALRGRHPTAVVVPVVTGEIDEPEQKKKDGKQKFRIIGAYKGSKWTKSDYAALVLAPQWLDADGTSYQIKLDEPAFESVRDRVKLKGLACGQETFHLSARMRHPVREHACEMCELLYSYARVYRLVDGEQVRNRESISKDQALIADLLLEAATVTQIAFSAN